METRFDIAIIGAGIAGLVAARELAKHSKKVLVIEATDRAGGRIQTITGNHFSQPVEEGAEFIHGNLPFTFQLLKEAGIGYTPVEGDFFRFKDGRLQAQEDLIFGNEQMFHILSGLEQDMSVYDFLHKFFGEEEFVEMRQSVTTFIEGYEAADIHKASILAMKHDLVDDNPKQYRINGGYLQLINFLFAQCQDTGCVIRLDEPVKKIEWKKDHVTIKTTLGTHKAKKTLITAPIRVLQNDGTAGIKFHPALTEKHQAAKKLGAGKVIKVILEFERPFWKDADVKAQLNANTDEMLFVFSSEEIPTWWTQYPQRNNILTGWLGGTGAGQLKECSNEIILEKSIVSLSAIFAIEAGNLRNALKAWHVANWQNYPFVQCAYSYATVGGEEAIKKMELPEEGTIFFAGEAIYAGSATGTVEAAITSALNCTKEILNSFQINLP